MASSCGRSNKDRWEKGFANCLDFVRGRGIAVANFKLDPWVSTQRSRKDFLHLERMDSVSVGTCNHDHTARRIVASLRANCVVRIAQRGKGAHIRTSPQPTSARAAEFCLCLGDLALFTRPCALPTSSVLSAALPIPICRCASCSGRYGARSFRRASDCASR